MDNTTSSTGALDAEELLHLALQAMEQERDEDAITYLKRAIALEPASGLLHYLLGAMYDQLEMTDRAIDEMAQAVTYAPELHIARFQLGLLRFTTGDVPTAEKVWEALAELPADHPLCLFRSGLLYLAYDEFAQCIELLKQGIEANVDHPSLNHDMLMMVTMAEEALAVNMAVEAEPTPGDASRHVLLSGYQGVSDTKDN